MTKSIRIDQCARGFLALYHERFDPCVEGKKFAFDRIGDLASWLVGQFPSVESRVAQSSPAPPDETDLRQGVSFTQHAVLDLLEQRRALWSQISIDTQVAMARQDTSEAERLESCAFKTSKLIEASARLLDAAERLTACAEARENG